MTVSFRALFVIVVASAALHISPRRACFSVAGYILCGFADQQWKRKRRENAICEVMDDWKPCKEEPTYEEKGPMYRGRLEGQNEIIAARVAELLRVTL